VEEEGRTGGEASERRSKLDSSISIFLCAGCKMTYGGLCKPDVDQMDTKGPRMCTVSSR